jgi:hypothetical protein
MGNISLGANAAPAQLLHLQKAGTSNFIRIDAGSTVSGVNSFAGMMLCKQDDPTGYSIRYDGSSSDTLFVSKTNNIGAFTSNIVSIKNTGNVGIGTDDPGAYRFGVYGGDAYVNANVYARGDVISSFSDMRLKEVVAGIDDPLEKIMNINAFKYIPNDLAKSLQVGDVNKIQVGISAQDVRKVLPEVVTLAPFDSCNLDNGRTVSKSGQDYLTVAYERMVPLLVECIKQLKSEVAELRSLKSEVVELKERIKTLESK